MKKTLKILLFAILLALFLFLLIRISLKAERIAVVEAELLPSFAVSLLCPLVFALALSWNHLRGLFSKGRLRFSAYYCCAAAVMGAVVIGRYFTVWLVPTKDLRALILFAFFYSIFHMFKRDQENCSRQKAVFD